MAILALGINHKTASIALREKLAFAPEQLPNLHRQLCQLPGVDEAVMLSTCNRSELYLAGTPSQQEVLSWLAKQHQLSLTELQACAYFYDDEQSLAHLAKVASGLDSLVLGEPQIFGQLKSAFAMALQTGTVQQELHPLFQSGFALAKQVRSQTAIGKHPVSVAYAAVSIATHIFSNLGACRALLVGAGETIELVAKHLVEKGVTDLTIANRTLARAEHLAQQFSAKPILLGELPDQLHLADIVISSTASQLPLIGKGMVETALSRRRRRPVFMVDIAVPRDIEPEVAELNDVFLYTVDDLQQVIERNQQTRVEAADQAVDIIDQGVHHFRAKRAERQAAEQLLELQQELQMRAKAQAKRHLKYLQRGQDADQVLPKLAQAVLQEMLHPAFVALRQGDDQQRQQIYQQLQQLLGLNLEQKGE